MSNLEIIFDHFARQRGIIFTREYKFHPTRKWRFDFADTENKIAIEIEGGTWTGGRHTRGSGYRADTQKYNAAVTMGWKVLRYTNTTDIATSFIKDYNAIKDLLKNPNGTN